jgi:hypothetical protein
VSPRHQVRGCLLTLAFRHHEHCTPTHGYEPTREAAMAAFAAGEMNVSNVSIAHCAGLIPTIYIWLVAQIWDLSGDEPGNHEREPPLTTARMRPRTRCALPHRCRERMIELRFHLPLPFFPPRNGCKMNGPTCLGKSFRNASCTWAALLVPHSLGL